MKINGVPVDVDTKSMGGNLVLVTPLPEKGLAYTPEDEEKIKILTERLCGMSGGRLVTNIEIMMHPRLNKKSILFTGDAWHYSVPFYNKLTR